MATAILIPGEIIQLLRSSTNIAVLTGAGISAESGIPTFREAQTGLWSQYDPMQLATSEAFHKDPKLVWDWYLWRREIIKTAHPNPGHLSLVDLEIYYPSFTLITQNVDGLHQAAGSKQVVELHGNIFRSKCSIENLEFTVDPENCGHPPRCPSCGDYLRPDVVWFGESLPEAALKRALQITQNCQVFLSIGTSALVEPAASFPFFAQNNGATVIEINPQPTLLTNYANLSIRGNAGEVLPHLVKQVANK
jgi:NAD-dependent deacetylase